MGTHKPGSPPHFEEDRVTLDIRVQQSYYWNLLVSSGDSSKPMVNVILVKFCGPQNKETEMWGRGFVWKE